jgi:hypothetical protein
MFNFLVNKRFQCLAPAMYVLNALVAHACNPTYSRGRDQEDRGSRFQASPGK